MSVNEADRNHIALSIGPAEYEGRPCVRCIRRLSQGCAIKSHSDIGSAMDPFFHIPVFCIKDGIRLRRFKPVKHHLIIYIMYRQHRVDPPYKLIQLFGANAQNGNAKFDLTYTPAQCTVQVKGEARYLDEKMANRALSAVEEYAQSMWPKSH